MSRADFGTMHCSMARALDVIGDPWTPLVLRDLYLDVNRFEELATDLGISRNLLTTRPHRAGCRGHKSATSCSHHRPGSASP